MAAFALCAAQPAVAQPNPLLIFEFPDGVRGGQGKISGSGPFVGGDLMPLLQRCGLRQARRYELISHRYFVYAPASRRDQQVIACFLRATSRHFNVGYGRMDGAVSHPVIVNEKPFLKFVRKSR